MRYALAPVALAALVAANPVPQGVTESISPDGATPDGCQTSYDGKFNIQIVNVSSTTKRSLHERQSNILSLTLTDGILTDSQDRTGYIAANQQFQFDGPPQTGAIYTAGWSVCSNKHLTLGDDDIFYSCLSGNFYNLYDENELNAGQCNQVYITVVGASTGGAASVQPDGQPTGSAVDVQPDGQPTGAPVSQIPDGQIQGVSQIADGQIQAPTSAAAPVSQIADGQIQAPTTTTAAVTQIDDGQIQAPTGVVSQISDGQVQAPTANSTIATPSVPAQTANAAAGVQFTSGVGLLAAIFGVAIL